MKWAAGVVQLVGIALTLFGVAVVRAWLERAVGAAADAKRGVARWWALRLEQIGHWWARRRRRPVVIGRSVTDTAVAEDSDSVSVLRPRADRATISDRDWLGLLDDRIEGLQQQLDATAAAQHVDHAEWERRLEAQRDELRREVLVATREGWALIVGGLGFTALGTVLQFWA